MKKLRYFLLFLIITINSFAQETEKLPAHPWEEIVELNNTPNTKLNKWIIDINISLEGIYTVSDSLKVASIIKKLENLTETISIKFSNSKNSNLKIKILDSIISDSYNNRTNTKLTTRKIEDLEGYVSGELYTYRIDNTELQIQNSLESKIAKLLVNNNFDYKISKDKRNSIFNPFLRYNNNNTPLNIKDQLIIKEIYNKGFENRLEKAEKKFKTSYINKLNENRILTRDRSLWWVKNPIAVILLPTIILLLLFVFIVKKINQSLALKIKKEWLRFGVITLIALLFTDILIVFVVSFYDFLTIPFNEKVFHVIRKDTLLTTSILLAILFPFLFLLRFFELKIQEASKSVLAKTFLIFISTGVLPFVILLLLMLFTINKGLGNDNYYFLSQAFLILMAIASIRALISYFIFKERGLIVENEKKLSNLRELNAKAELKSLQSQINPHFLYNALNSIASLAPIDAKKTQEMAHSLSDLFKYSINRKGKKMSTVKDEIEMVKSYLDIEKIRFGERLKFIVEVDKSIENYEIPLFLIQPLVENAVKHGISKHAENGKIILKIKEQENTLIITVSDSGPDFPKGLVSGHGLQTVYDLLRLSYENKATLNWTNTPEKLITVTIPKIK